MPQTRIVAALKAATGVTDLVAARIWPARRPQGTALPAITYHRSGGSTVNASAGPTATQHCDLQIDCYDDDYGDCKTVAAAVIAALNGLSDATDDPQISSCLLANHQDLPGPPEPGQDLQVHRVTLDFRIWYNAAP